MKKTLLAVVVSLAGWVGFAAAQSPPAKAPDTALDHPSCAPLPADAAPCARWWGSAEYLFWVTKDAPLPIPLITSGPSAGNLQPAFGQQVVIGGEGIDAQPQSGGRFILGAWVDPERNLGVEGSYFFLANHGIRQSASSPGDAASPSLALPFFDVTVPGESSTSISLPGEFAGFVTLNTTTRLQGGELSAVSVVTRGARFDLVALGGFRTVHLGEDLTLDISSPGVGGFTDTFRTHDAFQTRNQFYGGQVGLRGEFRSGPLFVQGAAKAALGTMHETVNVSGVLLTDDFSSPGVLQTFPGGYLALPTNIGQQSRDRFAVVPEATVNVGWQFGSHLRAWAGYTFLYLSDVVRPGDQIDRGINPTQAPSIIGSQAGPLVGPARPAPIFHTSDFWAQGVSFGVELRY
jgi:hypothetical protein